MPFFVVTMSHPDGEGWGKHVRAHVGYLKQLIAQGSIKASGRLKDRPLRSGFIIFKADDRGRVESMVAEDPFSKEGLIVELTINEWEPFFGIFASEVEATLDLDATP